MNICLSITLSVSLFAVGVLPMSSAQAIGVARIETADFGSVDLILRDDVAPYTVYNFLSYIESGYYHNIFISRSVPGFVVQGGGYSWSDELQQTIRYPSFDPINNEFFFNNLRGSIAMALRSSAQGTDPNSATNQWFINLADNRTYLDADPATQFEGYTVFGAVLGSGMDVIDEIALQPPQDINTFPSADTSAIIPDSTFNAFSELPLYNYGSGPIGKQNLVMITDINLLGFAAGPGTVAQAASGDYTILTYSGGVLNTFSVADNPSAGDTPAEAAFNDGFFDISVWNIVPAGGVTQVILTLPAGVQANAFYIYGKTPDQPDTPHWYNFTFDPATGTGALFAGNQVGLSFVDGERGDDAFSADGTVTLIGGPAMVPVASTGDGGGGGGAIDGLALLSLLLPISRRKPAARWRV